MHGGETSARAIIRRRVQRPSWQTDRRIGIQLGLFLLTLEVFNTSAALGDFADLLSHSDDCYDIY